jgi:alpha-beta hydrolase superfamily lysophospholipase
MLEAIHQDRRVFLRTAAISMVAAQFGTMAVTSAQSRNSRLASVAPIKPGTNTSFSSLRQVDAGLLSVGYAEAGPADGPVVVLLQGWPYDIYSYVDVAPLLASAGYRVIVPYLRGFGSMQDFPVGDRLIS